MALTVHKMGIEPIREQCSLGSRKAQQVELSNFIIFKYDAHLILTPISDSLLSYVLNYFTISFCLRHYNFEHIILYNNMVTVYGVTCRYLVLSSIVISDRDHHTSKCTCLFF